MQEATLQKRRTKAPGSRFSGNINKYILRKSEGKLIQYIFQVTLQFSNLKVSGGTREEFWKECRKTWSISYLNYSTSVCKRALKFLNTSCCSCYFIYIVHWTYKWAISDSSVSIFKQLLPAYCLCKLSLLSFSLRTHSSTLSNWSSFSNYNLIIFFSLSSKLKKVLII